jgi:hypothetical protein
MVLKHIGILLSTILFFTYSLTAQTNYKRSQFKKNPVWIQMMNDTSANYFATTEAFRMYFKDRILPEEPNEMEGNDSFEKQIGLAEPKDEKELEREKKQRARYKNEPDYAAEVHAFKIWFVDTKQWVREDGSIIGPMERQAIVTKQQQELQQIEKLNSNK